MLVKLDITNVTHTHVFITNRFITHYTNGAIIKNKITEHAVKWNCTSFLDNDVLLCIALILVHSLIIKSVIKSYF
jgi:hypothetical protein